MAASDDILRWRNVQAVPLIHGRLPFALHVRETMLEQRFAAVAVELPPSLREVVMEGVRRLPVVSAAVYREQSFNVPEEWGAEPDEDEDERDGAPAWYVPLDPCDGIVEALRIAERERCSLHFVDAEVEQFAGRSLPLPDPHALLGLGLPRWYSTVVEGLADRHRPTPEDLARESHMAARLKAIAESVGDRGPVLFLCGLAHWERIRQRLLGGSATLFPGEGPDPSLVKLVPVGLRSLFGVLGEMPYVTERWENYRSGIDFERHDPIRTLKEMLLEARELYDSDGQQRLERATPANLARVLDYVRRLTVRHHRLTPDLYSLVVAAKGIVGNDFALALLQIAGRYSFNAPFTPPDEDVPFKAPDDAPPTADEDWFDLAGDGDGVVDGRISRVVSRAPGEPRELRRVLLERRPPEIDRRRWRTAWNPHFHCSYPPEDVVIENLRSYVASRSLSLAGLDQVRTEEFQASLKDGLALRQTLRDLPRGKLHVKVEPRVPGRVGAVVLIFEEDDSGERYPWRTTWMAEHEEESTMAFYATDYSRDIIGPGIARARYGGCMMIFPPIGIPDVWDDLRFERARRPSERLLLAAGFWAAERFVTYVSAQPPSPEARATLAALGKHVVHLPMSSFSARTLEKVRTVHVLNHQTVRSWASRFIR